MVNNVICIFAAHPDDEILGCGATMAKHYAQGDEVHVIIMAEGITSRDDTRSVESKSNDLMNLKETAKKANKVVGATSVDFLNFPDNRMDSIDLLDITKQVEAMINKYIPNIIYTHHASDVNIDHQKTHEAVITACRPQPNYPVKRIMCFEVPSSTEWQPPSSKLAFTPNWYVDVSGNCLQKKIVALEVYSSEMRQWPHARSIPAIEALTKWRGATVGVEAAESFILARNVEK